MQMNKALFQVTVIYDGCFFCDDLQSWMIEIKLKVQTGSFYDYLMCKIKQVDFSQIKLKPEASREGEVLLF